MLRSARHAKILEIISSKEIETQEELCEELERQNIVVTQATISRDIRDLRLFTVAGVEKKYRYAYINESESEISPKMKSLFRECVLSIKAAQNLVVVRTFPGLAQAVAAGIDNLALAEVLGCVAGDDTILVATRNETSAKNISERIHIMMKAG